MIKKVLNKNIQSLKKPTKPIKNSAEDISTIKTLEALPVPIILFSLEKIVYANPAALNLYSNTSVGKQNLIKQNLLDIILPEFHDRIKVNTQKLFIGEKLNALELKIKNYKGQIINIEHHSNLITFNNEIVIQAVFTDISERIKVRENHIKSKFEFDLISENTSDLIFLFTYHPKPKFIYINSVVEKLVGYSCDEFLKNSSLCRRLAVNKKNYIEFDNELSIKQKNNTLEITKNLFQVKTKQGNFIWLEKKYTPIKDEKGNISYILVIGKDVTIEKEQQIKLEQQIKNYQNLVNSAPIGVFIHYNGVCLFTNKEVLNILEEKNSKSLIGKNLIDYIIPEQREIAIDRIKKILNKEVFQGKTYSVLTAKNNNIEVDFNSTFVEFNGKDCIQTIVTNVSAERKLLQQTLKTELAEKDKNDLQREIDRRKIIEKELLNQSHKLESIFESSSHIIWTVDKEFKLTACNNNFKNLFKKNYDVLPVINKKLDSLLAKDQQVIYTSYWYDLYNKVLKGNPIKFERTQFSKSGTNLVNQIYLNPIRNSNNEVIEIACLAHDVSENKLFEKQLLDQSAKLKAIFESGNQLMWTLTRDFKITALNQNYANAVYELYHFYPVIGKSIRELNKSKITNYESFWDEKYSIVFSGKQTEFTTERVNFNGTIVHRQYYLYPIKNINNEVVEVSGIGFDITENKKNEERISQSLKEKEILLKEVHHRVKNNMQVISSILNLQSTYVKDDYALSLLKECQNRIKSMAFIHESLYQTKNFEEVNFSEYVSTLTKNLVHTYSINSKNKKLILNLDDLFLNLDLSIPCGLIMNELISNSLKYAFPDNKAGIIFVNLNVKNKMVVLEISDNGVGIDKDLDIKQSATLGLQLVDTLVEQIGGTLKLDRTKGTKFIIEFNI